ncbi:Leucine-rich repeat and guanylate kinase domain-containing protein [Pteropus alecto]|uniref:Leucine-rich repeat and guanylate kinase domain-containing protein n=1 Tax=Pteropus alecto TaxID=9402 RepID=L5KSQ3_PTEAL|nr:Leucine-rich repeat and guanylate kinase domain-containing protein [Pteropus alecto]
MATSGRDPQWPKLSSHQGYGNSSRNGVGSVLLRSEKDRWSSFPMGQRPKGSYLKGSSYLLQQLIHRYQESDADKEYQGEAEEVESSESSESEMLNLEEEFDGVLREEAVAEALYHLGRSGSGTEQVYLNLTLSGCDLTDISILNGYVHLQKLDLSSNKIEGTDALHDSGSHANGTYSEVGMPQLLEPKGLIGDLILGVSIGANAESWYIDNQIEEISGLELCSSLTHLSLAKNKITAINGLGVLPIKILCLSHNQIEKITGLDQLQALQILDLSHNQIISFQGLENHDFLEVINLEDNKIAELGEIEYIENLPLLRVLNLLRNPIQVAAVNKYNPPPEVVATQDHLTHVVNSLMQPQRIFDSTLPSLDAPYPVLVLAGPQACGKRELAHRLCRQFSTYFRYGACHTTRPPYFGEGDRVDYHFISQEVFNEMVNMGKFILTFNYGNHSYGLNRDTIEGIARDGLASCIHMEIEGVRSLKHSYFEPRYILVVPMNKKKYEGHLRRKGLFSRVEIEFAVSRVDLYVKINQKFPGYFDAVINADDLDVAYQQLSQLIREYLGLSEETVSSLAPTADTKTPQLKSGESSEKPRDVSSCDLLHSTDRNYFEKLWARRSAQKSPVERKSLERQYKAARQALMGKTPPHHTLLFQSNKDSHMDMKFSALFEPCQWYKDLPFEPLKYNTYSHSGSEISDSKEEQAPKADPARWGLRSSPGSSAQTPLIRLSQSSPGTPVRPVGITHLARSSKKITLLQQPAKTRPTAKNGRMAGAGNGERARRESARLYRDPRKPGCFLGRGTEHRHCPGAQLFPGATAVSGRGAVVRSQTRPHSSERASESGPDYISQDAVRPYVRLGRVPPPLGGSSRERRAGYPSCVAR